MRFYEPVWEFEGCQLVRRPDTPRLHIYYKPRGSRRFRCKSTGTGNLEKAQRKLIEFVQAQARPQRRSPETVLLLDVMCDYVEDKAPKGDAYWHAATAALKHMVAFTDREGHVCVADFTLDMQERYVEWRRSVLLSQGYGASNGTLNRELGVAKAAMRWAWKRGRLESVPHVQLLTTPPPRDRFLRVHEVQALLRACEEHHLKRYVMLALHTLQRPIAIYNLRVEQVDLAWNRIDFLPPGSTQSKKRRPVVPITPSLRPFLEAAISSSVTGHVLEYQGQAVKSVKRAFATACKRAGLKDVTPYTLRHTGATLMAAAGVPMRQIAGMLGHSEVRTTELYAKHHPDFLTDAARTIETLFGSPAGIAMPSPEGASQTLDIESRLCNTSS